MIKVEKLNPFGRMCISLGMLPSSYKESLTYEEQLLWFCRYLEETVIPAVNNNAEALEELQNLYVEIKNYIDNYFDNLDVQEEINNKLDEMAESGELTDIIAQYLGLAGMLTFNTVSDMKNAENLVNGSVCKTLGYYSIDDGGGSTYKISNTSSGFYEEINNNLYAILLIENDLNVKQFGAYGDGTHDDTNAIQNSINYAKNNNYKIINIPKGEYKTSSPILLYDYIKLIGEDRINTSIKKVTNNIELIYNTDSVIILAKNEDSEFNYVRGQSLQNLRITSTNNSTYGIYSSTSAPYILFKNLFISDVETGICLLHGSWVSELNNINISDINTGISYQDAGTSTIMKNIYVQSSTVKAYDINGLSYSNLQNLCADWCTNIVYSFNFCNLTIDGLGSESTEATCIMEVTNGSVVLNSPRIFTNNSDENAYVFRGNGCRFIINGGIIGGNNQTNAAGKFITINTDCYMEFNKTILRTNFLTRSVGTAVFNVVRINDSKNTYSILPVGNAPLTGLGDITSYDNEDISTQNMNLLESMGGIFFNVYASPMEGATGNREWTKSRKAGDLFINQAPDKTGIAMYQQISEPKNFDLANPITNIENTTASTKTLSFTNLTFASEGALKQIALRVNDKVLSSSGGDAKINSIDYSNNKIVIKDINGSWSVGDTVSLASKTNFRDAIFREIPQLLKGTSSERILNPTIGIMYFDTTLGKPIWYKGSGKWVDSTGTQV